MPIPPPYGVLSDLLKKSELVLFLGAGASLSGRPVGATWDKSAMFLPLGGELSRSLADDLGFPSDDPNERGDLSTVASFCTEAAYDRPGLLSRIRTIFNKDYQLGEIHRFLAEQKVPLLIVTTNYDDLIERAFVAKGKPYHLVTYPTDRTDLASSVLWWKPGATEPAIHSPSKLPLSLEDTTIIYKMHGTVDRREKQWDSYVITEEDYVDFLSRMTGQTAIPARFMLEFRKRRFLFLGYGLRDWNFRVMLKNLRLTPAGAGGGPGGVVTVTGAGQDGVTAAATEDLRAWAIQHQPSDLELTLWRARKVNIYDLDIDTFVAKLRDYQ
jgi:hypothetical protein